MPNQDNEILHVFGTKKSWSSFTLRIRLDVDIWAKNSELAFGLVQFGCLGGRGIVTWKLIQIPSGICNTCATHPNFPRLQPWNLLETAAKC
jgi:hypothetical protein